MTPIIIKVTPQKMKQLQMAYATHLINNKVPYTNFVAKVNQTTITAYTSGKVMFQGAHAEKEAQRWGNFTKNSPNKKATTTTLPPDFAQKSIIGSDEVGNGSYFGPLVVCSVYAHSSQLKVLKQLGVKDSKLLTDSQIKKLAPQIMELVPYQKLVVTPSKYNQIQPTYNAVRMKVALHNQAIYLLEKKIAPEKPDGILIDQFTPEANYRKHLAAEKNQVTENLYFITKGEQYHLAVAAASILCRASFLSELEQASAEVGFTLPSGAGAKSDTIAAKILKQGGLELLGQYAKLHFANTEKAQKLCR
ncbi:MAG: ribonuclease HIII [Enterococcus sp.]